MTSPVLSHFPSLKASRNMDPVNYRELAGIRQNAKRGSAVKRARPLYTLRDPIILTTHHL